MSRSSSGVTEELKGTLCTCSRLELALNAVRAGRFDTWGSWWPLVSPSMFSMDIYERAGVSTVAKFFHGTSEHLSGVARFRGAIQRNLYQLQSP